MPEINHKGELETLLKLTHKGRVIQTGLTASPPVLTTARTKADEYSLEGLLNDKVGPENAPAFTREQWGGLPEEEKRQNLDIGFANRLERSDRDARAYFVANGKDILAQGGNYDSDLVKIAATQDIVTRLPEDKDARKLMADYLPYAHYDQLARDAAKGKVDPMKREEMLRAKMAADEKAEFERLRAKYDDQYAKLGAQAYALGNLSKGKTDDKVLQKGFEALRDAEEDKLKKAHGSNFKSKVARVVGDVLVDLSREGSAKSESLALNLYHLAKNNYQIGDQNFSEVYR